MREEFARKPSRINLMVNHMKGAQSGGSLITMFEQYMLPDDEMQLCEDPFCLDAVPTKDGKGAASSSSSTGGAGVQKQEAGKDADPASGSIRTPKLREVTTEETDQFGVRYNKQLNKWTYPFQFSPINSRVVRRTCALLYGQPRLFKCVPQQLCCGDALNGVCKASALAACAIRVCALRAIHRM
ncbi:MAG: hypothetical protein HC767_00900 [Akkermansiaceae bacterium]|nr:hypothetical protein [Akkermansiaceae bacterium]